MLFLFSERQVLHNVETRTEVFQGKCYQIELPVCVTKLSEWWHYRGALLSQQEWGCNVVSIRICVLKWKHVTPTNGYHMVEIPRSKSII